MVGNRESANPSIKTPKLPLAARISRAQWRQFGGAAQPCRGHETVRPTRSAAPRSRHPRQT
eukprot:5960217-Lingulodinium_polyedra.AAC.1